MKRSIAPQCFLKLEADWAGYSYREGVGSSSSLLSQTICWFLALPLWNQNAVCANNRALTHTEKTDAVSILAWHNHQKKPLWSLRNTGFRDSDAPFYLALHAGYLLKKPRQLARNWQLNPRRLELIEKKPLTLQGVQPFVLPNQMACKPRCCWNGWKSLSECNKINWFSMQ